MEKDDILIRKQPFDNFKEVMDTATKFKKAMLAKNLTYAKTHCPHCKGDQTLFARISGKKNHFHMQCRKCKIMMME